MLKVVLPEETIKNYQRLFFQIGLAVGLHQAVEEQWFNYLKDESIEKINLNRKEVRDYDDVLKEYVYRYRNFISIRMPHFNEIFIDKGFQRIRVKDTFSIKDKIEKYNGGNLHVNVNIKMLKKWNIKMYSFLTYLLPLELPKRLVFL